MSLRNKQNQSSRINSNRSGNHPSFQSIYSQSRPSIKIGYKVTPVDKIQSSRRMRKKVNPFIAKEEKAEGRKKLQSKQLSSGHFVGSEYIKKQEKESRVYHKKGVNEAHEKYQNGKEVEKQLKSQFNSRRSYSTSNAKTHKVLPSYQECGIKDVLEYHHAKPYREIPVSKKCTQERKSYKFNQLHEFDFRKRPEFLR